MKDGDTLNIDGVKYKTYQTVTNRRSSTYQNTLVVDDVIENITGSYTCKVANKFGSSTRELSVRGTYVYNKTKDARILIFNWLISLPSSGIQVSSIQTPLTVGDTVSIVCSTDLDVTTIEWIRDGVSVGNSSSQSLTLVLNPVSSEYHNTQYTCRVKSPYGVQEETVNITVQSK